MFDLNGKVALITGSSDGIGAATALLFSSLGAKVIIHGRDPAKLEKMSALCQSKSPICYKPVTIRADFEDEDNVKRTFQEAINVHNRLDILVNNAGTVAHTQLDDPDFMDDYDRLMKVNVRAYVQLTLLAKDHLARSKGVIVNVSSVDSVRTSKTYESYAMSKAAVNMLTYSMALSLAPDVRVNAVGPGPTRTNILRDTPNADELWESIAAITPLKRLAEPEEMANQIAHLASDVSKNMTGSIVFSDGGYLVIDPRKNIMQ